MKDSTENSIKNIASIAFLCFVIVVTTCARCYFERRLYAQTIASHVATDNPKKDEEEIYSDIESSLINMFVIEHDDKICPNHHAEVIESSIEQGYRLSVESVSDHENVKDVAANLPERQDSAMEEGEEESERNPIVCSICLDPFRVHDIVSMSPKTWSCGCHHIFHHICIKEWLLHHTTCPSCREEFLDNSNNNNNNSINHADRLDHGEDDNHSHATISTANDPTYSNHPPNHHNQVFYCIQHGIMILRTKIMEQYPTPDCVIPEAPKKEELMLLRLHPTQPIRDHENNTPTTSVTISFEEVEELEITFHQAHPSDGDIDV